MTSAAAQNSYSRVWLAGFLLTGVLLGMIGPMLVGWQYHLDADPRGIGLHFLALNAGYVVASLLNQRLFRTAAVPIRKLSLIATAVAIVALLSLTFAAPPVAVAWRLCGLILLGAAAGTLITVLFHSLDPAFHKEPGSLAGTLATQAGTWFGGGCLLATLCVGAAYAASSTLWETGLLACVPAAFLVVFARTQFPTPPSLSKDVPAHNMRQVATVLFTLLLFFQFGCEWALAGWLPLFLVRRLGSSPTAAIFALAVYFLFLVVGRWLARALLPVIRRRKLLLGSTVLAMGGYLALANAATLSGAYTAIVIVGFGFGPIYPLILETLDQRFSFQPRFYNGIFSIAITGAMAESWLLGYVCDYLGMQYVVLVPALGSVCVCVLTLLLMLEAHTMREVPAATI